MTDREALEKLFDFLSNRTFVAGPEEVVKDMVKRYQQPPWTMHQRVVMQMTVAEYQAIGLLLTRIAHHLKPAPEMIEDSVDEPV